MWFASKAEATMKTTNRQHVRMFGLSLFTRKRACFVPHDYKKSPSDLSLTS